MKKRQHIDNDDFCTILNERNKPEDRNETFYTTIKH